MKKVTSVEEYIENNAHYKNQLETLRALLLSTALTEHIKWNAPVYSINNKNIVGLGAFKNHFCLWFFNGVFLKDKDKLLYNAQEEKTKALRQLRFDNDITLDTFLIKSYIEEAIINEKLGKTLVPDRHKKPIKIPEEIETALKSNKALKNSFNKLSHSKQKEYCDYITTAKKKLTKQTRLEIIIPLILKGTGLNDKYKNC